MSNRPGKSSLEVVIHLLFVERPFLLPGASSVSVAGGEFFLVGYSYAGRGPKFEETFGSH